MPAPGHIPCTCSMLTGLRDPRCPKHGRSFLEDVLNGSLADVRKTVTPETRYADNWNRTFTGQTADDVGDEACAFPDEYP